MNTGGKSQKISFYGRPKNGLPIILPVEYGSKHSLHANRLYVCKKRICIYKRA